MKHTFILILFLGCFSLLLTGCNTIKGFGEDISSSASYVQRKMTGEEEPPPASTNPPQWPKN